MVQSSCTWFRAAAHGSEQPHAVKSSCTLFRAAAFSITQITVVYLLCCNSSIYLPDIILHICLWSRKVIMCYIVSRAQVRVCFPCNTWWFSLFQVNAEKRWLVGTWLRLASEVSSTPCSHVTNVILPLKSHYTLGVLPRRWQCVYSLVGVTTLPADLSENYSKTKSEFFFPTLIVL